MKLEAPWVRGRVEGALRIVRNPDRFPDFDREGLVEIMEQAILFIADSSGKVEDVKRYNWHELGHDEEPDGGWVSAADHDRVVTNASTRIAVLETQLAELGRAADEELHTEAPVSPDLRSVLRTLGIGSQR